MCFPKSDLKKKKQTARMLVTVVRSGDAPRPPFPIKTDNKLEKSGNQDSINHPYFSVCIYGNAEAIAAENKMKTCI